MFKSKKWIYNYNHFASMSKVTVQIGFYLEGEHYAQM